MSQATILETLVEIDNKTSTAAGQSTNHTDLVAVEGKQDTGNTSLASIDAKVADNFGVATGAVRVAAQLGNASGAADFNSGVVSAQTPRVILASDQLNAAATGSASANNTDVLSFDTNNNYRSVYFQIIGTFVGTISFQSSSDNFTTSGTTFVLNQNSQTASAVSTATTNGIFIGNVAARYWRARFTAFTSGTATVNAVFSPFPYTDIGNSKQVTIGSTVTTTNGTIVAQGAVVGNSNYPAALGAVTSNPTAVTNGQYVRATADKLGRQVHVIGHARDLTDTTAEVTITGTVETTLIAQVAAVFNDIYSLDISNTSATVGTRVDIRDTTAGTVIKSFWVPALSTYQFVYNVPLKQSTVNTNWTAQLSATPTGGDVRISAVSVRNL